MENTTGKKPPVNIELFVLFFQISITANGSPVTTAATGTLLTAVYSGNETVAYQWQKDGTSINSARSAAYTPYEPGSYAVIRNDRRSGNTCQLQRERM